MSTSQSVYLWKQKAAIDYIPLFIPLWLSLDAWMRDRFIQPTDRNRLELLKRGTHTLSETFSGLIQSSSADGSTFKAHLANLHRALVNTNISYEIDRNKRVSFDCVVIDWNNQPRAFESLVKESTAQNRLEVDVGLWLENDPSRLFAAYMEIVYQVRCSMFHGDLAPTPENERVIQHIYLTLSILMAKV